MPTCSNRCDNPCPSTADPCLMCARPHKRASPFCSAACERHYHNEERREQRDQMRWKRCAWCDRKWWASRGDARFCSGKCRTASCRARHAQVM
jgi:hypothetical protein